MTVPFGTTPQEVNERAGSDGNAFFPSPDPRLPSPSRGAQRVERPCTAAVREQHEKPAGDRQIFLEMQELIAVAELGVKEHRGDEAKPGKQQRGRTGVIAAQDQNAAPQFDRDGEGNSCPGTPNACM